MKIKAILRDRGYLALALIYAISVAALCLRAPVVQRDIFSKAVPIALADGEFEEEPSQSPNPKRPRSSRDDDSDSSLGFVLAQPEPLIKHAPLWALSSKLSLNVPLFAAEQAELIGLALIVTLAYGFRARLVFWGAAVRRFFASRRRGGCVWLGFMVVLALALFPPWVRITAVGHGFAAQRSELWHAPLFREPKGTFDYESSRVDYPRMLTEIVVGECFVLALYLTWARTKQQV